MNFRGTQYRPTTHLHSQASDALPLGEEGLVQPKAIFRCSLQAVRSLGVQHKNII